MPFDGFVENTQVTERLVIGRTRIEAGWCQGIMHRWTWTIWRGTRSEYCLLGSMSMLGAMSLIGELKAEGYSAVLDTALALLMAAQIELGYDPMPVTAFNDSPGRTKAQVLDVLDLAIAMSRGKASTAF